ncbi:Chitosanase precursor [Phycisphaerae bacterium RAS1]|nr:Chitosanase precursor [Phycisphaerae bacterium RAS1]
MNDAIFRAGQRPLATLVALLAAALLAGCPETDTTVGSSASTDGDPADSQSGDQPSDVVETGLTPAQRLRADQFISIFENDTLELQYAYIGAIEDGRGYTAGRAGFTSATGDMLVVVERYVAAEPQSALAAFLPRLRELAAAHSGSLDGLAGLPPAWEQAAEDARFRDIQDAVVAEEYFDPALQFARELGLTTALGVLALYDANIQHGAGDDPDGVPAMIARTSQRAGGAPADGVDETEWLSTFLEVRRATLLNATDPETREAWAQSTDRVTAQEQLVREANFNLDGPININTQDHQATIP